MNGKATDRQADFIKIFAVLTAAPRWAGALMAADGVPVPPEWFKAWQIAALVLSVAMAAVEGFAISYVFNAWRNQKDKASHLLLWLAVLMLVDFGVILAPYIVANVSQQSIAQVLAMPVALWVWSGAIAASTGLVVGSVGYAQKEKRSRSGAQESTGPAKAKHKCPRCPREFASIQALSAHKRFCDGTNGTEASTEPEIAQAVERE